VSTHAEPKARTQADEQILQAVDACREEMLDFVVETVRAPSVNGEEGVAAPVFESWFERNGFAAVVEPVDPAVRDRSPLFRNEHDLEKRPNVYGTWSAARPQTAPLVLNGHLDVIPAGDPAVWTHPPYAGVRDGGRIYGRGATDMKGQTVAGMYAVRAVRDCGIELPCDVQMQVVMGEESGGLGTLMAIHSQPRPSAAIVLESTEMKIAPACGGVTQFTIVVEGRAMHTSLPWRGVSALDKAVLILTALNELAERRGRELTHPLFDPLPHPAPFAIGTLKAGEWRATMPDRAVIEGRIGAIVGETIAEVRALLEATIAEVAARDHWLRDHPPQVAWINEGFAPWETDAGEPIVAALTSAFQAAEGQAPRQAVTYGSDASHFAAAGIPVVLFGPGDIGGAHLVDEFVADDELVRGAKVLALALARYGDLAVTG
jgi:acetylornithine deacetylase